MGMHACTFYNVCEIEKALGRVPVQPALNGVTNSKTKITNDQLEQDFIPVEALSPEDLQYTVGNAKDSQNCSPHLSRRRTCLTLVKQD